MSDNQNKQPNECKCIGAKELKAFKKEITELKSEMAQLQKEILTLRKAVRK